MKAGWWTKLAGDECDLCELAAQGDSVDLRTSSAYRLAPRRWPKNPDPTIRAARSSADTTRGPVLEQHDHRHAPQRSRPRRGCGHAGRPCHRSLRARPATSRSASSSPLRRSCSKKVPSLVNQRANKDLTGCRSGRTLPPLGLTPSLVRKWSTLAFELPVDVQMTRFAPNGMEQLWNRERATGRDEPHRLSQQGPGFVTAERRWVCRGARNHLQLLSRR